MKLSHHISIKLLASICIFAGFLIPWKQALAADTGSIPVISKTVTFNQKTYTLNTCNLKEVYSFNVKARLSVRSFTPETKKKIYIKLKLLQLSRQRECSKYIDNEYTGVQKNSPDFVVVNNPSYLDGLSATQKEIARERAYQYIDWAEDIVNVMIKKWVLSAKDKEMIRGKIQIQFVDTCKHIDGLTTIKYYDPKRITSKDTLLSILLNVSVCENRWYSTLFDSSYKHVLIHELGHYIYFLKDETRETFENICWTSNTDKRPECTSYDGFYSKYAMTDSQEDYAETFAYWYQWKKPEFALSANTNITLLQSKTNHFSTLFK